MYKLIIADDERRIRMGLKNIVEWEKLGFEVTELFTDGQEVIEYLDYVMPDVILTDIKMNHISGLEVAKYVFEHSLPCKVVLVSGYQEFELAVQGIKYGAEDYLLKPTDVDRIEETFAKLKQQLDNRQEELQKAKEDKQRVEEMLPLLEERFFADLVMGVVDSQEYVRSCMGILYPDCNIDQGGCFLADIYIKEYDHFMNHIWEYNYDQFEVNLSNFLQIYRKDYGFHIVYKSDNLVEIIGIRISDSEDKKEDRQVALESLLEELEINFKFQSDYKIRQEYGNIFEVGKQRERVLEKEEDEIVLDQYLKEQKKLVMSNITMGNIIIAQKLFRSMMEEMKHLPVMKRNNIVIDMMSTMYTVIMEINETLAQSLEFYFNYSAVLSIAKAEEVTSYIDRIFDRIRMADEKKEYYDTGSLISKAKAYINDNIYQDISQEEIANDLFICSAYLSRMFKKKTGESFLQYVTRVKMEKAIELLRDPQYKTYQVSEMLGYKTPRYFSRLFRSHTGMNPSEYRGRVLNIGGGTDEA